MASNTGLFQDSSEFFEVFLSHHTQSTLICGHEDHPSHNTVVMWLYVQKYLHILLDEILSFLSLKKNGNSTLAREKKTTGKKIFKNEW